MFMRLEGARRVMHRCVKCHREFPHDFTAFCDQCGGMIDVHYDLERARLHESENPLERFLDLLPVERAQSLLPQEMRYTPCVHAVRLGASLGMPALYLKNETVLPTGTTKDRMAVVSLAFLSECGVRAFCTSSTGNSSTAYAHAISRYPGMRLYLFTAESFRNRVQYGNGNQVVPFVLRGATFVDAFNAAGAFAATHQLVSERGFFNPGRREGLKLAFLEACEQVPGPIDWYVQAVSSAMGVYGAYKGARELTQMGRIPRPPRLLCVQQETCAPMVRAFGDGSPVIRPGDVVRKPTGIAEAILRGDPTKAYPHVREIVVESGGTFVAVSESEIREARCMVEELEGISPCFSASAALAGVIRLVRRGDFPRSDTVMINLTGSDRRPAPAPTRIHWLRAAGGEWEPEDADDEVTQALWQAPAEIRS
ncbi:MAG: threonine synthase [Gemmatimonadales bacterium]